MVFLHHLHGVGAGGNICDGVTCSVTLDNSLIRSFGRTAFGELNNHFIGIAVKARCRAGNGVAHDFRFREGVDALGLGGAQRRVDAVQLQGKGGIVDAAVLRFHGEGHKGAVFLAAHKSAVLGEAVFWSAPFALVQYSVFICVDKPDETGNIHLVAGFACGVSAGDGEVIGGLGYSSGDGCIQAFDGAVDEGRSGIGDEIVAEFQGIAIVAGVAETVDELYLMAIDQYPHIRREVILGAGSALICQINPQFMGIGGCLIAGIFQLFTAEIVFLVTEHSKTLKGVAVVGGLTVCQRRIGCAGAKERRGDLEHIAAAGEERASVLCRLAAEGEDTHAHHVIGMPTCQIIGNLAGVAQVALTGLGGLDGNEIHIHGVGLTQQLHLIGDNDAAYAGRLQGVGIPLSGGPIAKLVGGIHVARAHTVGADGGGVGPIQPFTAEGGRPQGELVARLGLEVKCYIVIVVVEYPLLGGVPAVIALVAGDADHGIFHIAITGLPLAVIAADLKTIQLHLGIHQVEAVLPVGFVDLHLGDGNGHLDSAGEIEGLSHAVLVDQFALVGHGDDHGAGPVGVQLAALHLCNVAVGRRPGDVGAIAAGNVGVAGVIYGGDGHLVHRLAHGIDGGVVLGVLHAVGEVLTVDGDIHTGDPLIHPQVDGVGFHQIGGIDTAGQFHLYTGDEGIVAGYHGVPVPQDGGG